MNFNWQTEETEERWEAGARLPAGDAAEGRSRLRRRWPAVLALLLLLLAIIFFFYRQAREQVAATEATVKERVVASHQLLLQTAERSDRELFANVLSGRDEGWTETQKQLLVEGVLFARPGLGLRLQPAASAPLPEVALSPGLGEATVTFHRHYTLSAAGAATETIRLAHQAIYRRGPGRWLYAPPDDPDLFWGESQRYRGERLTLTYPAREAMIAQRLAGDLDEKLVALCRQSGLVCAGGWRIHLAFDPNPARLSALASAEPASAMQGRLEFALPAPSLVGLPVDDAAYRVVFQWYARYVLTSAVANLLAYDCCRSSLFLQALIRQQLAALALAPPLLSPAATLALMDIYRPLGAVDTLWQRFSPEADPAERRLVQAFVAFLLTREPAVVAWQRALVAQPTFTGWLHEVLDAGDGGVAGAWPEFVQAQVEAAQATRSGPARSLPAQELLLACKQTPDADDLVLVRHRPGGESWVQEEVIGGERAALLALPGDESVLLYRYGVPRGSARSFSWQLSDLRPLTSERSRGSSALLPVFYTPASSALDPRGQYLVLLRWNREERVSGGYRLFDLACRSPGCDDAFFPGIPIWSPDGSQVLAGNGRWLWRMTRARLDERLAEFRGRLPFWLDDTTFGFLAGDETLLVASSADDEPRPFLQLEQLAAQVPGTERQPLELVQILAAPARPGTLLLVVQMPARARNFIFRVERAPVAPSFLEEPVSDDEIHLLWETTGEQSPLAYLLDQGRLLAVSSTGADGSHLRVFDLARSRELFQTVLGERMGTVDFSADGDWLALTGEGFVELVALPPGLDTPERHFIFPPFAHCTSATWIREAPAGR